MLTYTISSATIPAMLKIRLQRDGRKHEPTFRVVVTDSHNSTKSGRSLEVLGSYDPRKSTEVLDAERITYWISKGAQVSDTMHNLLISKKIIEGKKVNPLPRKQPIVDEAKLKAEADAKVAAAASEAPAEEVAAETPIEEAPVEEKKEEAPTTE